MGVACGLLDPSLMTGGAIPKIAADQIFERMKDWLLPTQAASLLGVTYPNFKLFRDAKMFTPCLTSANGVSVNERHSRTEIVKYLKGIRAAAVSPSRHDLKTINATAKSLGCKITEILDFFHTGRLTTVAWDASKIGLSAVLVDPTEVGQLVVSNDSTQIPAYQLAKVLHISPELLTALINRGALPTVEGVGVRNRFRHRLIRREDADAFQAKYVTFQNAAREFNVTRTRLREAILLANLTPLFPYNEVRALLFDRGTLASALRGIEGERLPRERRKTLSALPSTLPTT